MPVTRTARFETPLRGLPAARKLIVVSNRLPFSVEGSPEGPQFHRSPGGLVAALEPVLTERGGVWVGWNGLTDGDDAPDLSQAAPTAPAGLSYRPVRLTARELARYYDGFSNRTLWPLLHYSLDRMQTDARTWRVYEDVNERFARAAAGGVPGVSTADTMFWIHDYHLLRAPLFLRRLLPKARIAFFLHVPFPAADVFRVVPWSRALMRGMLAADLVGFHVDSYARHFLECAERLLGCEVERGGIVHFEGREVSVQAHPIGVDVQTVERLAARASPPRAGSQRVRHILGVDRLDYTKGVHARLLAVERLLETHPEYRGRVIFTQILVPSRERVPDYTKLKQEIDEAVGRINGRFSEKGWSPVRYLVRSLPADQLVAYYRRADVALVTPRRDGMNLVAKEYVAAQLEDDGVLILSELAGAAEELQEALLVNPIDIDAVAEALDSALSMPDDERRARMSALRDRVRSGNVHRWVRRFLAGAEAASDRAQATVQSPLHAVQRGLGRWLARRPAVVLFLDYDGTLTPIVERPENAVLSDAARDALVTAFRAPNVDVVIVSGRSLDDVRARVGVRGITYIGNHGFQIDGPGLSAAAPDIEPWRDALERAAAELDRLGIPGAWVERKEATLSYHVRQAAVEQRVVAVRRARTILTRNQLEVLVGNHVVDARPPVEWHKGAAVLHVLRLRHGADWMARVRALYIGDDATDEEAFRSLKGLGKSVCVAPQGPTLADESLSDPGQVIQLVRWIASGAFRAIG